MTGCWSGITELVSGIIGPAGGFFLHAYDWACAFVASHPSRSVGFTGLRVMDVMQPKALARQ